MGKGAHTALTLKYLDHEYFKQLFTNLKIKDSFKAHMRSRFKNCPWFVRLQLNFENLDSSVFHELIVQNS